MAPTLRFHWPYPSREFALMGLTALYLLSGLIGHDPWKADDATHFGIAFDMLDSGRWWLPSLAGQPLTDTAPLYYWLAAACARLFGGLLPLHDAARLATGIFAALTLAGMSLAARRLYGPDTGRLAVLILLGCLGLLVHIHDSQPLIALLAATAWVLAAISEVATRPLRSGLVAGLAAGLAGLAAGWLAILALAPLPLLLALAVARWRTTRSLLAAGAALAIVVAVVASWALTLSFIDEAAFALWRYGQLRQVAATNISLGEAASYLAMLPWFAWPALPLALWALWRRRTRLAEPQVSAPMASFVWFLLVLSALQTARSLTALPLLLPLVLLAVPGALDLRRGAANAFDWFAAMTFSLAAGLVWLGWIAMLSGWPPKVANNFAKLEPGFVLHFSPAATALAALLTLAWLWLTVAPPRIAARGTLRWAAGMTLMWCLISTLWLPWVDYGKSYRGLAASLSRALPEQHSCIAGRDLGEAQRASLHYFASIKALPQGSRDAKACELLLTQVTGKTRDNAPPGWKKIWEGRRSGDRNEIFHLYSRG